MHPGIFEIIGPVMVGPSSSHTAGAAKIGAIARQICGSAPARVDFYLHGSFAETYEGHGTGQALIGGVLGLAPDDPEMAKSIQLAHKARILYKFHRIDLGDVHPNTVKIVMITAAGRPSEVIASSIGGGGVVVISINRISVEFTGDSPTIVTIHHDQPGVIADVTKLLAGYGINVAYLKVFRQVRGGEASMVIEADDPIPSALMKEIKQLQGMNQAFYINLDNN